MGVTIWSGLTQGAIFALIATGFTLAQVPSGVFNFAQGALVVGGTYLTYLWFQTLGISLVPAILLNIVAGIALGTMCEFATVRPLRWGRTPKGGPAELVTTVGMSTALIGAFGLIWGFTPLNVPFHGPTTVVTILGIRMFPIQLVLVVVAIVAALGLWVWFRLTRLGQACLAVAEDRQAATLRGINVALVSTGAFAAAGCLATLSGMVIGPESYAIPTLANSLALAGFVALAIGGEASFVGGLLGGFAVGLVSAFSVRYLGANYSDVGILILLLVTLSVRPHGFAGAAQGRRV